MTFDQRIERLSAMTLAEKRAEWRRAFATPSPPAFSGSLMVRAIVAQWQEKAHGALTRQELRQLEVQIRKDQRVPRGVRAPVVKPGTWLSRTWHGDVHEVIVLEGAFEYRGTRYRSLTAIARLITGAACSGPRFFGLHSPRLGTLEVARRG